MTMRAMPLALTSARIEVGAVAFSPFMEPRPRNLSMMETMIPITDGQMVDCLGRESVLT